MTDDAPPRRLAERTGKHYCVRCLAAVPTSVYFDNDCLCEACTELEEYPYQSTPNPADTR